MRAKIERNNKYGNTKTSRGGFKFSSSLEARYYDYLCLLKNAGIVFCFSRQRGWDLPGGVRYFSDFSVHYTSGEWQEVDVKGVETHIYTIKRKQVEDIHKITITVIKKEDLKKLGF
jgi:GTPase